MLCDGAFHFARSQLLRVRPTCTYVPVYLAKEGRKNNDIVEGAVAHNGSASSSSTNDVSAIAGASNSNVSANSSAAARSSTSSAPINTSSLSVTSHFNNLLQAAQNQAQTQPQPQAQT